MCKGTGGGTCSVSINIGSGLLSLSLINLRLEGQLIPLLFIFDFSGISFSPVVPLLDVFIVSFAHSSLLDRHVLLVLVDLGLVRILLFPALVGHLGLHYLLGPSLSLLFGLLVELVRSGAGAARRRLRSHTLTSRIHLRMERRLHILPQASLVFDLFGALHV